MSEPTDREADGLLRTVRMAAARAELEQAMGVTVCPRPPTQSERLDALAAVCAQCTKCPLAATAKNLVFGEGHPDAALMFVGEAPGEQEDLQGRPFVGPAGELLTKIIQAIDLQRQEVFIANVLKHRPPGNRDPQPEEIAACKPYLLQQIDIIRPKVIVTLGSFAARCLLETQQGVTKLRGRFYDYHGTRLMPTFHPAYLLRNEAGKRPCWEDMKQVRDAL